MGCDVATRTLAAQGEFEHYVHNRRVEKSAQKKAASRSASRWAKEVMARDAMTCQICGSHDDLHAHHIFSRRKFPLLRSNVDNGVTLCSSCHPKWHAMKNSEGKQIH
jgi:5-methylcytosine-specific restriction endonuclease McrA